MTDSAEPTGTVPTALAHAAQLLKHDPLMAAEQALQCTSAAICYSDYHAYPIKPMNFGVKFGQKF
jgi:hypothetical protein